MMRHALSMAIAIGAVMIALAVGGRPGAAQTSPTTGGPVDAAIIEDLVAANRILAQEGIVDAYGHVSIRHPGNPNRYLLSRSLAPILVAAHDIIEYDLDSNAIDARGRVFVGDRSNNRIQIFDQDGTFLNMWTQFGKPSGIFFDRNDQIFVADSESDNEQNPGWEMGIRIGDARTGWINAFILYPWGDPRETAGNGAEFVAVDRDGNVYGGEPRPRRLQKYVRVRP